MRVPLLLFVLFAALAVAPAPGQTPNLVDPTFRAELTAAPDLVVPLADGRIYVTSTRQDFIVAGRLQRGLARLMADGSLDASFDVGAGIDAGSRITSLDVLTDGRVALVGTFTTVNGVARPTVARLLANGSHDPNFQPDSALIAPNPTLRYPLLNGQWILGSIADEKLTFVRYTAAGNLDPTFRSESVDLRQPPPRPLNPAAILSRIALIARDPFGRQYFGTRFVGIAGNTFENIYRLSSSGELEPAIVFALSTPTLGTFDRASENAVEIDDQRALIQYSRTSGGMFGGSSIYGFSVQALPMAPAIRPVLPSLTSTNEISRLTAIGYGFGPQARLSDDAIYAKSFGTRGRNGIVRLGYDGNFDQDFSCEIAEFNIPAGGVPPSGPADFLLLANGQILLRATSVNGTPTNFLARLTPNRRAGATRLGNASALTRLPANSPPLLLGYVVANGQKNLLARATGPALSQLGVASAIADPVLSVSRGGAVFASNDDWPAALSSLGAAVGAFPLPSGSHDAALSAFHLPGAYALQVADKTATGGATLAELYDLDPRPAGAANARLVNFSARAGVSAASGPLTAGFTIEGDSTRTVMVRAVGPGLARFGLAGTMPDPVVRLFRGSTVIATNSNWGTAKANGVQSWSNPAYRLEEMFTTVRAFALDSNQQDAALSATLPPGAYTVQVASASNTPGTVLLEVYEVP